MSRLPDFLILGAMKCATSTLHEQLARQPGFFLSEPKEPCFFSDDAVWRRGPDWYRALFADAAPGDLCGESSTHYTKLPTHTRAVERMRALLPPATRFVYVMRHPVERLISHYIHEWSVGTIDGSVEEALGTHPELVEYGRYAHQLAPYLEAFGPERVLPVFLPRLESRPQEVLEQVCRFLGYAGQPRWHASVGRQNVSRERMRECAARDLLMDLPGAAWLRRALIPRRVRERIKDLWRMKHRPRLCEASLAHAQAVFDRDLAELGRLLGLPLCCASFDQVTASFDAAWAPAARRPARRWLGAERTAPGVVVIGRNEGARLAQCLDSLSGLGAVVVYADSGSTDGSPALARTRGVAVLELDPSRPFTAARGRNEGFRALRAAHPWIEQVQFLDGDCRLLEGWLASAVAALDGDVRTAVVAGRRREARRETSIYNRLCDMEWNTPLGRADECGGDFLVRVEAFEAVGGFDERLIAGEEPDLCARLRAAGWDLLRVDSDMTAHDADLHRFRQWWRRSIRAGHAAADNWDLVGSSGSRPKRRMVLRALGWCLIPPAIGATALLLGIQRASPALACIGALLPVAAWGALFARVLRARLRAHEPWNDAALYASFAVIGKLPEACGVLLWVQNRLRRRPSRLVEYKGFAGSRAAGAGRI